MVRISFITSDGRVQAIDARIGMSLMENAVASCVEGIDAVCGGNAYCGTCRVYIDPVWLDRVGSKTDLEDPMLYMAGDEDPAARLSCQITVTEALDGLVVHLPASQT
jgi:2Fe-2S ferredoxin